MDCSYEVERFRRLSAIEKIGWWEIDFFTREVICSEYLCTLLGMEESTLSFYQLGRLIWNDCQDDFRHDFLSLVREKSVYERMFPINSVHGVIWARFRLGDVWISEEGHRKAFGILQEVSACNPNKTVQGEQKTFKDVSLHQPSVSYPLDYFMESKSLDQAISGILKNILDLFHADRVYICEYDADYHSQDYIYEIQEEGIDSKVEFLHLMKYKECAWWVSQITSDKSIIVDSISDLRENAKEEYELLKYQGVKSLMTIPLQNSDRVWGYIGVELLRDYKKWTDKDYSCFSSLANIINLCISLKRLEKDMAREQEFQQNLYKYMPVGYIRFSTVCDKEGRPCDYYVTDANQFSSDLLGVPLASYKEHFISEVHQLRDVHERLELLSEVYDRDTYEEFDKVSELTGKQCHCIVYTPEPNEYICLYMDVTEMRQAYTALDYSENLLCNLFSNIPVGIEVYDTKGLLVNINNKDMEIFGIKSREDVLGINFFANPNIPLDIRESIKSEDKFIFLRDYELSSMNGYFTTGKKGHLELNTRISKIYGNKGDYVGFILINIDNTERISSINRIREFEHFFSLISDFAKVGYAKLNLFTRDGYAIRQWYKNMGEDESTPLPRIVGVYGKMHPEDRKHVLNFYSRAREGKETYFKREMRVLKVGTTDIWNWVRMHIIVTHYEPENELIELIGVNYDISELKKTESLLIEAKEKAEAADRLKTAFLANMSHEIRTPLNAIVGFSSLLTEAGSKEEKQEYLKVVEDNNERLLRLISDILDLSRIETDKYAFHYEEVDVNVLCDDVIASMRFRLQPGVRMIFKPSMLPRCLIISDCNRLQQVISNFISNAIKFTSKGFIEVGYDKPDKEHIRVYVKDTGIGIAKAECERIFDRFVKLNVFKPGSGLGLSICKSIIEQMGGAIGVDSELEKGSSFWFVLPMKRKESL